MKTSSYLAVVALATLISSCKTTEATEPKAGPALSEAEVIPVPVVVAEKSQIKCSTWAGDGSAAFAFEANGTDENTTLQTAKMITTRFGQIPAGSYKMVDGSPVDGSCLEYYADISSTIKPADTESSGLIVSNCDVAEESEWRVKAYVRRVEGHAAEMIFDERYNCSVK